jgi:hypothetical protein
MATNLKHLTLLPLSAAALAALGAIASPAPAQADPLPYGPDTCLEGFVWREARDGDTVCVTPAVRNRTAEENQLAASRREPNGGAYGPDTCKQGYVWREAFDGDTVCVTPEIRAEAVTDNAAAESRKAANTQQELNPQPLPPAEVVNTGKPPWCALPDPLGITPGC